MKLTFLPFIVKAVVAALKKHPIAQQRARRDDATSSSSASYYNIGIAAATDAGLMVPVVRDADRKSLLDIAREIERLADRREERQGRSREDLGGSTFTITSLGQQGGLFATPIINFPEVGILGVHQMKQKPVVQGRPDRHRRRDARSRSRSITASSTATSAPPSRTRSSATSRIPIGCSSRWPEPRPLRSAARPRSICRARSAALAPPTRWLQAPATPCTPGALQLAIRQDAWVGHLRSGGEIPWSHDVLRVLL